MKLIQLWLSRIGHCAFSTYSLATSWLPAPSTDLPLFLPPTAVYIRVFRLLCGSTMASDWVAGEEGVAVVYSGGTEYLVD